MTKVAVINSSTVYNLGAEKIAKCHRDQGDEVIYSHRVNDYSLRCDKAYLSAIFTPELPIVCEDALKLISTGITVEIGGPAPTALPEYVEKNCGIKPHLGLDERFERVQGNFTMSFTSRGCPNRCSYCIVPKVEPTRLEYNNFTIPTGENPFIGDNNILATSWEHQKLVVEKLRGVKNLDINSGFEASRFTEEHYRLYSQLDLECFRLAFDSMDEEQAFTRAVKIIRNHAVAYRNINVYVLIGYPGTTYEDAVYRLEKTRALGCSPYPQRYQPLDTVHSKKYVAPGWDADKLEKLRLYWVQPRVWRKLSFEDFIKSKS